MDGIPGYFRIPCKRVVLHILDTVQYRTLVLHILQYVQYSHMGSIARTGYSIADTGTSTLEHTSRHPHVLGNNFVPYVFQKLRLAQIRM